MTKEELLKQAEELLEISKIVSNNPIIHHGYYKDAVELILALSTKVREQEWQPIETAPKDGTIMILWSGIYKESYHGLWDIWIRKPCWKRTSNKKVDATHWMPLPQPIQEETS